MAFATRGTPAPDWEPTAATPFVVNMPSSIAAGQALICHVMASTDADDIPTPSGWTRLCSGANNGRRAWAFGRVATGSDTLTFDRSAGARLMESEVYTLSDWHGDLSAGIYVPAPITGFPPPDFGSQTVPWGVADTKWLLLLSGGQSVHTAPANYTEIYNYNAAGNWGIYLQAWERNLAAASEDPPAMGADVTVIGFMLAIRPVAPAPELTGGVTTDAAVASGTLASATPSTLTGNVTTDDAVASGTLGAQPGTLTSSRLALNNDTPHLSAPFEAFISLRSTGVLIVRKTGLTSSATNDGTTHPRCTTNDPLLVPGTLVRVTWRNTSTGAEGTELLTVA
jgi:hypothetical protein